MSDLVREVEDVEIIFDKDFDYTQEQYEIIGYGIAPEKQEVWFEADNIRIKIPYEALEYLNNLVIHHADDKQ